MFYILKNRLLKGVVTREFKKSSLEMQSTQAFEVLGAEVKTLIRKRFGRSLHLREVDTGSCGACESEIITMTNPFYDVQRFGINFVASPRHADALLVTGPVSKNMVCALKKTYDAMPADKFVITLGDCAKKGGVFEHSYYTEAGVEKILPVTFHIPGCPPHPVTILDAFLSLLKE